ncbi:MAG: 4Fe-4S dicluster domain-containing protein, partial [candidate division WOR-3 bacterium]
MACRHCEEPLCAAACPTGALTVVGTEKTVVRHDLRCIGCRSCVLACPWGVIDERLVRSVAQKCNQCQDRAEATGRNGPRCVSACPTGALQFLAETELKKPEVARRFLSKSPFWRRDGITSL